METRYLEQILRFKRLLLYGIGNQFKECYKLFKGKNMYLFDGDIKKIGRVVDSMLIHSPQEITQYIDSDSCIVITSIFNQYEIARMLVENIGIPPASIFMYTSHVWESYIYKPDIIQKNWDRIVSCTQRLSDDESRTYYLNIVHARLERNPLLLVPNPKCTVKGEYGDTVCLKSDDVIVDCGAYIGDTAEMYMNKLKNQCMIYAIEPYEKNYEKLVQMVECLGWNDKVKAYNCAVGKAAGRTIINYDEDDFGMAFNLSNMKGHKHQEIMVETLDSLLDGQDVSYIKMDIEGEELNALEGAKKLIMGRHPRMMISGYHKVEDLWEIPEIVWSIYDRYKIYAGHAPGTSMEIEFYCIAGD